jgi:chromate reductase
MMVTGAPEREAAAQTPLRIVIIQGSTRVEGPPRPARLGQRVALWCERALRQRGHHVDTIDPVETPLPLLVKPHFAYAAGRAPPPLEDMAAQLRQADAYVCVTPEYNHGPSPALLNTLNHFGSSVFSFKPSAIVSYSQGQWGGTRAAAALRPILSELGCLPVSAMVHVPKAHEHMDETGVASEGWSSYGDRVWGQLEWWATAAAEHRKVADPFVASPALVRAPAQRNAP